MSFESPHSHDISPSLSSVESLRSSLPESYQSLFGTLRKEVKDFCDRHSIPTSSLNNDEALREATKHLSNSDLEQLSLVLKRLEYLVTHREPMREKSRALEYADEHYHLSEQYFFQVSLLEQIGVLKDGNIEAIDGNTYPVPTLEQIAERLYERREELGVKRDQGFTKLVLVPFGMSLDVGFSVLRAHLVSYKKKHPEFTRGIPSLPNKSDEPGWDPVDIRQKNLDVGDSSAFVYHQTCFDKRKHGGKTKTQILEEQALDSRTFPGWVVRLFQPSIPDDPSSPGIAPIPREMQGKEYGRENPRPDIEAGLLSQDTYLSIIADAKDDPDSPYFQESGLTPEDWIFSFITHLQETGKTLDTFQNKDESSCGLMGAFFPSLNAVPVVFWLKISSQAVFGLDEFTSVIEPQGTRFSVMI